MDIEHEEKVIRDLQRKRDIEEVDSEEWKSYNNWIVELQTELDRVKDAESKRVLSEKEIETNREISINHDKTATRNKIIGCVIGGLGVLGLSWFNAWASRDQVQDNFSKTQLGKFLDNSIYRDSN